MTDGRQQDVVEDEAVASRPAGAPDVAVPQSPATPPPARPSEVPADWDG
ncbi:MAG: hypothetical protein JWP95_2193, partial [Actinotalea sp.]|nr:hypothetical protein [Actinotalea sp.]